MISAFGMCCGYYNKFLTTEIDMEAFYSRRYKKIVPFFGLLILIALVLDRTLESLYEAIIEITLLHGLLPNNNLSLLGVSWTLGVIFVFYLVFPYFTYLLRSKKRAWISLLISLLITYLCEIYYFTDKFVVEGFAYRHCFLYCAPFFMLGGIIYIYKENIENWIKQYSLVCTLLCLALSIMYYVLPTEIGSTSILVWKLMLVYGSWLCLLISCRTKILDNKVMHYLGSISLEMYLAQMIAFRVIEKLGLLYVFGQGWIGYICACIMVVGSLIIFVILARRIINILEIKILKSAKG